jgi:HEAT repeat protein
VLAPYDEYTNSISDVRNNALCLLPSYQDRKEIFVPLIINAMKDPNPLVRMRAVDVLNKIDPQNASSSEFVPVLVSCLASPVDLNPTAVNESALMLGEFHRDPDVAVPALIQSLQDPDPYPWIRANSAWALGRFGGEAKSAIPALTKALKDSDAGVRRQAADALERINPDVLPR